MTLREWLDEAEAKGYPIAMSRGLHVPVDEAIAKIAALPGDVLSQPVHCMLLDELFFDMGKRGVIAETPDGYRVCRLEPHPHA